MDIKLIVSLLVGDECPPKVRKYPESMQKMGVILQHITVAKNAHDFAQCIRECHDDRHMDSWDRSAAATEAIIRGSEIPFADLFEQISVTCINNAPYCAHNLLEGMLIGSIRATLRLYEAASSRDKDALVAFVAAVLVRLDDSHVGTMESRISGELANWSKPFLEKVGFQNFLAQLNKRIIITDSPDRLRIFGFDKKGTTATDEFVFKAWGELSRREKISLLATVS